MQTPLLFGGKHGENRFAFQYIKKSEMSATKSSEQGATDMIRPRRAFPVIHIIQGEPVESQSVVDE